MSDAHADGLTPAEIAAKADAVGVSKGSLPASQMFLLAVLAGAFIAMGAIFYTVVSTGNGADGAIRLPYGIIKTIGGAAFCLGLILVVVAGGELFTGNSLMVIAAANGRITLRRLLWNWVVVYLGNFAGALATAYLMFLTAQHTFANGNAGRLAMEIGNAKCGLEFVPALTRGIYCNALVCLAVWLCYSCKTTSGRILAILFPITAFVAAGFEHCVANMYFVPAAIFIQSDSAFWASQGLDVAAYADLGWRNFVVNNLAAVTLGNIIGGALFVGALYWYIFGPLAAKRQ